MARISWITIRGKTGATLGSNLPIESCDIELERVVDVEIINAIPICFSSKLGVREADATFRQALKWSVIDMVDELNKSGEG